MSTVFISHSTQDKDFVERLATVLSDRGLNVWYSKWTLHPADSLRTKIVEGINGCDFFLVVISRHSINSSWVRFELDIATIKDIEVGDISVVPVIIGALRDSEIPIDLRAKLYVDFRYCTLSRFEEGVDSLMELFEGKEDKFYPLLHGEKKELINEISRLGSDWAKKGNLFGLAGALTNPVPDHDWSWWRPVWQAVLCLRVKEREEILKRLFSRIPNSCSLVDVCKTVFRTKWENGVRMKKAERLAVEHMRRLQPWGGRVLPEIKWYSNGYKPKNDTTDGRTKHRALEASAEMAKLNGREAAWHVVRGAMYELVDILSPVPKEVIGNGTAYDFADAACWLVTQDLMETPSPFDPLIQIYAMGLVPEGYGLESPSNDYFYIRDSGRSI